MTKPFEAIHPWGTDSIHGNIGLTKREYFAAMALQGIIAHPKEWEGCPLEPIMAGMAVCFADALIAELNK